MLKPFERGGTILGRVRYGVAASLDGWIAGPNGESDWITVDPAYDFAKLWAQFDTFLMGRVTYEAAVRRLGQAAFAGRKVFVLSRTLYPKDHPGVAIQRTLTPAFMR